MVNKQQMLDDKIKMMAPAISEIETNKISLKRTVIWWTINPAILVILFFALTQNIEWCVNIVKFVIWANFIIWSLITIGGKESWKANRKLDFSVSALTNGVYGIVMALSLAAGGWFWYAAMELMILIAQNTIHFGDIESI